MKKTAKKAREFFLVDSAALPDAIRKTALAKRLLELGKAKNARDAAALADVSRSAYYKYKDMVFPFYDDTRGKAVTLAMDLEDRHGVLSRVLSVFADSGANIVTIHATMPINGVSNTTVTVRTGDADLKDLDEKLAEVDGVVSVKIIARE